MKIQAKTIEEFFQAIGEKESDLRELDQIILETIPDVQRGLEVTPSISMIAYWPAGMSRDKWPVIALAPQKHYLSLYVSGVKEGQSIGDYYANRLGKTNNGKGCIRFRHLSDVDIGGLQELIRDVFLFS